MTKLAIKNRHDQKLVVVVEEAVRPKGLAFVMHGLGGSKDEPHIQKIREAFSEAGYTVIAWDAANTFGESEGDYEQATVTNYYEDLEDVIEWAKQQVWYQEPFVLAGHSLGGIGTAWYAEKHREKIKALAPISTVVSGQLSIEAHGKEETDEWRTSGIREERSWSNPARIKRLPWSHMEDRLRYDLLPGAGSLTMPVLMVVGEQDDSTPPSHQQILFDAIPSTHKELHIIPNALHSFHEPEEQEQLKKLFSDWLATLK